MSLSTPGVVLPWFSVTRLTARALPLNEWVSLVLQGLHLTPSAFLCCLDDTRLEPTHIAVSCRPVHLVPFHLTVGGRTSKRVRCHLLCLLCLLIKFSRQERPNGSLLAFAQDDVALWRNPYPSHYRAAFAFSVFLCPQPHRPSLRLAVLSRRITGFPRSVWRPG